MRRSPSDMRIADFDYELPEELIAQHPLPERDASRMLTVDRRTQSWQDSQFRSLPDYLREGDVLVLNNTRVFPARLRGRRASGGVIELLLLREIELDLWEALARPARRLKNGEQVFFDSPKLQAKVVDVLNDGVRVIRFELEGPLEIALNELGEPPLPPYIKRTSRIGDEDRDRYQTVYASQRGAIAAPTAGLHFTPAVLEAIEARGVGLAEITLHVGYGTFEPVKVDAVQAHRVAPESFSITDVAAQKINATRKRMGRIVAVGTTTARALESATGPDGRVKAQPGLATLTVVPGFKFRAIDALLTNFHLPRSSLLMLVSAFVGREFTLKAYRHAVEERYRFYSYGDCMFIT